MAEYFFPFNRSLLLNTLQGNRTRSPSFIALLTQTSTHAPPGRSSHDSVDDNDEDLFGEHYFHICIYIWACVVVSSLMALSVVIFHVAVTYCQKWGCCGRSLTRWEVKRIPLRRFQKTDGDESQDKCPICHEEFLEGRLIRVLPCNHYYHSFCVDRWLVKMSNRCPLCKQRVAISLFCPWSKPQKKKDIQGLANAEAEAVADEPLPLPPLSTLTPQNWYGEDIMSGPSKFIIMRPGRPTRVIDVRAKKKTNKDQYEVRDENLKEAVAACDMSQASEMLDEPDSPLIAENVKASLLESNASAAVSLLTGTCPNIKDSALIDRTSYVYSSECCVGHLQAPLSETRGPKNDYLPVPQEDYSAVESQCSHNCLPRSSINMMDPLGAQEAHSAEVTVTLDSRSSSVLSADLCPSSLSLPLAGDLTSYIRCPTQHRSWPDGANLESSVLLEMGLISQADGTLRGKNDLLLNRPDKYS